MNFQAACGKGDGAMALACDPTLLIADEPITAPDVTIRTRFRTVGTTIRDKGMMILISHDLYVVADTCDSIMVMYAGRQVEVDPLKKCLITPPPIPSG
jgi:peptide/nickel transport system ATP-binding protein